MKAVVLAAGLGKRMGSLTKDKPKALVELNGKPLLLHVLEGLQKAGVEEAIVVIGFHGEKVKERLGKKLGKMKLSYVLQRIPMGTAHALLRAKKKIRGKQRFLVGSTDVIVPPGTWKRLASKKGFDAVVALRKEKRPENFGIALVSGRKLAQIVEKPSKKLESGVVNAGCYLFSEKVFPALKKTKISARGEFELTDTVNALASSGRAGFVVLKGKCLDIGTKKDLERFGKKNLDRFCLMPIRKIKSGRKGCKPFVFFKGTVQEIREMSPKKLVSSLEEAGAKLSGKGFAEKARKAEQIRKRLVSQLEQQGQTLAFVKSTEGGVYLRVKNLKDGKIALYQNPATHGVGHRQLNSFNGLQKILREGFKTVSGLDNVFVKPKRIPGAISASLQNATFGDSYSLELMAPLKYFPHIDKATPQQIMSVNILLSRNLDRDKKAERKKFYKREITEKFGIPVHFI